MTQEIIHKVKNIITTNNYLTLATLNSDTYIPIATPLFFACDKNFTNFYWVSSIDSQHSQDIEINPFVSIVIFDSKADIGMGLGVYMTGTSKVVVDSNEIESADEMLRIKCNSKEIRTASYYATPHPRRIYKFTPRECWINTQEIQDNQLIDKRLYIN